MGPATGLTAAGLRGLRAAAEGHVGNEKVPGLVALVARGGQVHAEALGTLSVGGPPVARDSIFRIASTTKPITAAATLALAGEGSSPWTSRWTGCCPNWPAAGCCGRWMAR